VGNVSLVGRGKGRGVGEEFEEGDLRFYLGGKTSYSRKLRCLEEADCGGEA